LASDFPAETRIVEVNHVRPDGEPANPFARQLHVQPHAGFLPHGPGDGTRDDGRVALNPQPAATAGYVSSVHRRLMLNFPPVRGTLEQPRGVGFIQIRYPAHNAVRLHQAQGQRLSKPKLFFAAFHDFDFILGQAVKLINQRVNLRVRDGDLAFQRVLVSEQVIQPQDVYKTLSHVGQSFVVVQLLTLALPFCFSGFHFVLPCRAEMQ
jgi:hypothetical protein